MKKIARTLRGHRALILNYFRARNQLSSGVVEGLNNKAKLTMRKSDGFGTFHVTEIALYHALANCRNLTSPTGSSDEALFLATVKLLTGMCQGCIHYNGADTSGIAKQCPNLCPDGGSACPTRQR
jgi:hypothetical protein